MAAGPTNESSRPTKILDPHLTS